jgi:hypothetical protein
LENSTNLYGSIIELTNGSRFIWKDEYSIKQISSLSMLVFTDGRHNANPSITLKQTTNSIGTKKVYVAALKSSDLRTKELEEIGQNGKYVLASDIKELKKRFIEVQDIIKKYAGSLYYLYYRSPISDPTARQNKLEIRIKNNTNGLSDGTIKTSFNSQGFN